MREQGVRLSFLGEQSKPQLMMAILVRFATCPDQRAQNRLLQIHSLVWDSSAVHLHFRHLPGCHVVGEVSSLGELPCELTSGVMSLAFITTRRIFIIDYSLADPTGSNRHSQVVPQVHGCNSRETFIRLFSVNN